MSQASQIYKLRNTSAFKYLMSVHWWMFYCYIILFVGGAFMARLPRDFYGRSSLYDFHKTIGAETLNVKKT